MIALLDSRFSLLAKPGDKHGWKIESPELSMDSTEIFGFFKRCCFLMMRLTASFEVQPSCLRTNWTFWCNGKVTPSSSSATLATFSEGRNRAATPILKSSSFALFFCGWLWPASFFFDHAAPKKSLWLSSTFICFKLTENESESKMLRCLSLLAASPLHIGHSSRFSPKPVLAASCATTNRPRVGWHKTRQRNAKKKIDSSVWKCMKSYGTNICPYCEHMHLKNVENIN